MKRNRFFTPINLGCLFSLTCLATGQNIITTIAGNGLAFPRNVTAKNAPLGGLTAVTLDSHGNLYVADATYNMVFEINPHGAIQIVAGRVCCDGNGQGFAGDNGPATAALLSTPTGIALDPSGNLFIADDGNGRVRKVTTNGVITTVAGGGKANPDNGGPTTSVSLYSVVSVAVDASGNLFLADSYSNKIRKVSAGGVISTFAGGGDVYPGNGGPATSASLLSPVAVALDTEGNLFISESVGNHIRKVSTSGVITTMAVLNNSPRGLAVDESGNVLVAAGNQILNVSPAGVVTTIAGNGNNAFAGDGGPASAASLLSPSGVAVDGSGIYIADANRVRLVSTDGTIATFAGNGTYGSYGDGGPATSAVLFQPGGVAVDAQGNLFIADTGNNRIQKVTTEGVMTTIAGNGTAGFSGDGGPAAAASLNGPTGVAVDSSGNVYIADYKNGPVRKVSADGRISTVATPTQSFLFQPAGVAVDSMGNLFIADNNMSRVLKLPPSGTLTTVAGVGEVTPTCTPTQSCGDGGPATAAILNRPEAVAVDASGHLFIADTRNQRIRRVSPSGVISTVAGNGSYGFSGDGGPATSASLEYPAGVAVDASGNLFIADYSNNEIRKVSASGIITTIAGPGTYSNASYSLAYSGPATSAGVYSPTGVAVDPGGDVFFSDQTNSVREIIAESNIPIVSANGIVNGASLDSPVIVPGEVVSLLGFDLGPKAGESVGATTGFQETSGAGVSVTLNGTLAPLFYVGSGHISLQAPWELEGKTIATLLVTRDGKTGPPRAVQVQPYDPAIFTINGRMAILDSTGKQITPTNPASAGATLSIHATGLGTVSPAIKTGELTPRGSLFKTVGTPAVTVGAIKANVTFSGLVPGAPGVYQVNFTLPHGLATGDQPLVLTIGGISTQPLPLSVR